MVFFVVICSINFINFFLRGNSDWWDDVALLGCVGLVLLTANFLVRKLVRRYSKNVIETQLVASDQAAVKLIISWFGHGMSTALFGWPNWRIALSAWSQHYPNTQHPAIVSVNASSMFSLQDDMAVLSGDSGATHSLSTECGSVVLLGPGKIQVQDIVFDRSSAVILLCACNAQSSPEGKSLSHISAVFYDFNGVSRLILKTSGNAIASVRLGKLISHWCADRF